MPSNDAPKPEFRIESWDVNRFIPYARNPRKNDGLRIASAGRSAITASSPQPCPSLMAPLRRKSPSITVPSAFARIGTRFQWSYLIRCLKANHEN
jgi:hypothetical protein